LSKSEFGIAASSLALDSRQAMSTKPNRNWRWKSSRR
jgi:hypothetical protein